jgi:hypothetical protein
LNARGNVVVVYRMAPNGAGKDARKGDRHKDAEARRAYMRDYMRGYMRKRRVFGQPTAAESDLASGGVPAAPARPAERTAAPTVKSAASPVNPAMGPLHADFVAEHNRTGGFLRPA